MSVCEWALWVGSTVSFLMSRSAAHTKFASSVCSDVSLSCGDRCLMIYIMYVCVVCIDLKEDWVGRV